MTVLRSLNIELGLTDNVSNRLLGIDNQINRLDSGVIDTQSGFDDLGRATTEYGRIAGNEIEGVGKDIAELDKQVEGHADITAKTADSAVKSWGMVGAAIGGAAFAAEAFVQSQQDMQYTGAKVAYMTGLDKREVAGLASELTTITMSIEDVYGVMEIGAKQGLNSREELEKYVRTWDDLGTALEEDPVNLARQAIALRSVGIDADNLHDSYGALGFMIENTQWKGSEFLGTLGYIAKDMDDLGMSIDDVAITFAALERFRAQRPEDARRLLRTAMSGAKGDLNAFYRELKITDDELAQLHEEFEGGADYIAMANKEYAGTRSTLQVLGTEVSKVTNMIGADLNPVIGVGSAVMTGLSTIMITAAGAAYLYSVVSTTSLVPSLGAATASAWAFTAALLANPLTWVVVGIVALGAALYLLWTNWDDISGWFMDRWEQVGSVVTGAISWISGAWDATVGWLVAGAEWLMDHMGILAFLFPVTAPIAGMNLLRDNWDTVVGAIAGGWDWLVGAAQDGAAWLGETIGSALSGISDLFWQYHPIGIVIRQWDEITSYLQGIDLFETGKNILLGLVSGILDIRQQAIDAVMGIGEDILNAVTGFFGISSPSKLMQEMGGHVGEGFALGVAQSMPESIPLPEPVEGSIRPGPVPGGYATVWTEPAVSSLAGEAVYSSALTEPVVEDLTGRATYSSTLTEPVVKDLAGRAVYSSTLTEPVVEDLAGRAVYSSTLTEPVVEDLTGAVTYLATVLDPEVSSPAGEAQYTSTLTEPAITDLAGTVTYQAHLDSTEPDALHGEARYTSVVNEPTVAELTGAITYLSTVIKPVVSALTGNLTYESRVSEPTNVDRAGTVVYEPEVSEPTISALTSAITYVASVLDPFIPLLTGVVTYLSEVLAPEVPAPAGTIDYGATLPGPEVPTLTGDLVYEPEVSEPTVSDLTGAITYLAKVVEPVISALTGDLTYETRVSEPTIIDRNGTVVYENEVSEPTISALTSAITYVASVLEPFIKPLMGYVQYEFKVTEPEISDFAADITYLSTVKEPNITALERNVLYRDQPPETPVPDGMTVKYDTEIIEPELAGLTGAITYLSEIIKPIVETLEGIIEYRGIITEPIIPEHISRGYDIPEKQIEFESPDHDAAVQRYDYQPENDTVSTPQSVYSTFAPSTTIHITASGNDAQTIATAVDRRLRQTFDQHAETYFARQIRRKGLGSNI